MIPVYCGFDEREAVGYHAFCASVIEKASVPVSFIPIHLDMVRKFYGADQREGTNAFAFTRFLIPYMQDFTGWAVFADAADMVMLDDIANLWELIDPYKAVQVVKHDYKTKHPVKYIGTQMEAKNRDYPRKNWSSLMLINCAHYAWRQITPERVENMAGLELHQFGFIDDRYIGELPILWNWLVDEYGPHPSAKMLHWTAGIPGFDKYKDAPMADKWFSAHSLMNHATS